jgi:phosphate starvation-inducible PhoH-like protein
MPRKKSDLVAQLDQEQRRAFDDMSDKAVSLITGKWGTGKTFLAVYYALSQLEQKNIDKIYISRPTAIAGKGSIGSLPGTLEEKMYPYLIPIYHNFYSCYGGKKERVDAWLQDGTIEIVPIEFMRGVTFQNSIAIVDEIQNTDDKEMRTILSRLGKNSQLILMGDKAQCDLKQDKNSGLINLTKFEDREFIKIELKNNHRHPIVQRISKFYEKISQEN